MKNVWTEQEIKERQELFIRAFGADEQKKSAASSPKPSEAETTNQESSGSSLKNMDFVTDIEKKVLMWIEKIEPEDDRQPRLWGRSMDGSFGFEGASREFFGTAFLIGEKDGLALGEVAISQGHVNRRGFFWRLTSDHQIRYPDPPFLITNVPNLRYVGRWQIVFEASEAWAELSDDENTIEEFCVCTPEWFGFLSVDKKKSRDSGELRVWSDRPEIKLSAGKVMFFASELGQPFGKITAAELLS